MKDNIHPRIFSVSQKDRMKLLGQKPVLVWFTGLSGSGKSTLANGTESSLFQLGYHTYLLDGDNIRSGLNRNLSFSHVDRTENLRRIGEVCKLMLDAGLILVTAFISPFIAERKMIKDMVGEDSFLEIFVDCPLSVCEERDIKGLYKKARDGSIIDFTGIDSPYEKPEDPFLVIKSAEEKLEDSIDKIINALKEKIKY